MMTPISARGDYFAPRLPLSPMNYCVTPLRNEQGNAQASENIMGNAILTPVQISPMSFLPNMSGTPNVVNPFNLP